MSVLAELQDHLRAAWNDPELTATGLEEFGDGNSGHTYRLDVTRGAACSDYVLRLSPPGLAIRGPADVGRQGRIMAALSEAGLPAPRVVAFDSTGVLGGRAFALMARVPGEDWSSFCGRSGHRATAQAAVDALHRVQRLPLEAAGFDAADVHPPLSDLARWARLLERCPAELRPQAARLQSALERVAPPAAGSEATVLVHGDFHYGNLIFGPDGVAAVVDWEIASAGHHLTDLACLAVASLRRRYHPEPNPTGNVDVPLAELIAMYGAGTDSDFGNASGVAPWFIAAGCLKYAAIIGYNLELHRSGKRIDAMYERLQGTMTRLLTDAEVVLAEGVAGF